MPVTIYGVRARVTGHGRFVYLDSRGRHTTDRRRAWFTMSKREAQQAAEAQYAIDHLSWSAIRLQPMYS